jgi:hypothetical protein
MKIFDELAAVPKRTYALIFLGVFFVAALSVYFLNEDTRLLEKQISSRQKDLSEMLRLKNTYEMKKHASERLAVKKADIQGISLAIVEEMVAKNFVGGTLTTLQPATTREGKGSRQTAVEVKVTGAPLGEIVSFVKAAENVGLQVGKLRLTLPAANPTALDMQATIVERRTHG